METSSRVDQSLERASRVLELTNVEAIAQAERGRRIAELKERRLPSFLKPWEKTADDPASRTIWECMKASLLAILLLLYVDGGVTFRIMASAVIICFVLVVLQTLMHSVAVKLFRVRSKYEWIYGLMILPFRLILPGFFIADGLNRIVISERLERRKIGGSLFAAEFEKELATINAKPSSDLVREYAVAEIDKIKAEIVGPGSMLAKTEKELQEGFDEVEAMRLQVLHRMTRAENPRKAALEQGMELAKKRVANLRKALTKHRDVMARARAILDECRASAEGLGEAVEDSELLGKLEAGEIEDERKIALSELVMDQAVGQLRNRVMSLEGVLAQLEAPRCRVAEGPRVVEDDSYLDRIEHVAEQLAVI